jgi:N-acylglucosamine-6-phosphate 2-epimerase
MSTLDALRGGLIVSVQAWRGSAIDDPAFIAAMAQSAQEGGAVGVRVEGAGDLRAVRARVRLPMIGLIKREYAGFEPYITPGLAEIREVIDTGAEIVAFDATGRPRPDGSTVAAAIEVIHDAGRLALADCATVADATSAAAAGADAVATTLCGYTPGTRGHLLPALDVVAEIARLPAFCICEGGIRLPPQVRTALEAGADAVVVGTAITNVDWLVREFAGYADGGS